MKKASLFFAVLLLSATLSSQELLEFNAAISQGAQEISNKLPARTKIVVLNFKSDTEKLTSYIIDELNSYLVNLEKLDVLDRKNLELIQQEMKFQLSGEVSDDSAQAIGKKLGAQTIISGQIENIGSFYRFRIQVIEVETAKILVLKTYNVASGKTIDALQGGASAPLAKKAPEKSAPSSSSGITPGQRFTASLINPLFGAGSFIMGDSTGGLLVLAGEGLSVGLFLMGASSWEYIDEEETEWDFTDDGYTLMTVGAFLFPVAVIFAIARPYVYNPKIGSTALIPELSPVLLSDASPNTGLKLTWTTPLK